MRMKRIAAVTAGLVVVGGVFGTIAGVLTLLAWGLGTPGIMAWQDAAFLLQISLVFGGVPGAVLGPLAAWLLMRHIPLGLAVGGTTLGTVGSGVIGLIATGDPVVAIFWGMAGFGITAIGLRLGVPRRDGHLLRG